jgi:dienelactone hydrolase
MAPSGASARCQCPVSVPGATIACMTTVLLFHSVLGIRQGELDAAERLRAAGHEVVLPDLFDGKVFDGYEPAMAHNDELGRVVYERGLAAAAPLADGFVVGGFSAGSNIAVNVALKRSVSGVLQFSGLNLVEWFGDAAWPAGVDSQSHQMVDDPFRDGVEEQALIDVTAAGGTLELFDYPGSGHLFTDPTLVEEYDAAATELVWERVLPFVAARG